jgi:hypothetical protein
MPLDNIPSGVAAPEVIVNANFVAVDPAKLFAIHLSQTAGLTLGIYGGNLMVGTTPTLLADVQLTLAASQTNYVEATTAGVVSSNTSAFTAGRIQIGIAVTNTTTIVPITGWTEKRTSGVGGAGSGGGGGFTSPSGTGFLHATSGALDGAAVAVNLSGADATGTLAAARMPALTGDVTTSAGAIATTIATNIVTNAKAAQMAAHTFKGNNTGSTANAIDLTATQLTAELNAVVGDSGSGGTKGMVPAPGSGDAAAGKFLKADGTFAVPAGGVSLSATNVWTKNQSVTSATIASSATLNTDASLANTFVVNTLAVNATLANPTNLTDGMVLNWIIKQDGTGSRTLAYGSKFKFFGGAPTLSTPASSIDMISGIYNTTLDIIICQFGKAAA